MEGKKLARSAPPKATLTASATRQKLPRPATPETKPQPRLPTAGDPLKRSAQDVSRTPVGRKFFVLPEVPLLWKRQTATRLAAAAAAATGCGISETLDPGFAASPDTEPDESAENVAVNCTAANEQDDVCAAPGHSESAGEDESADQERRIATAPIRPTVPRTKSARGKRGASTSDSRESAKRARSAKAARERAVDREAEREAQEFFDALIGPAPSSATSADELVLPRLEQDPTMTTTLLCQTTDHSVAKVDRHDADTEKTKHAERCGDTTDELGVTSADATGHEPPGLDAASADEGDATGIDARDVYDYVRREQALRSDEANERELLEYAKTDTLPTTSTADMFAHSKPARPRETARQESVRLMTHIHNVNLQRLSVFCTNDLKLAGFNRTLRHIVEILARDV